MEDTAPISHQPTRVYFDATLRPNRSLGPFGFRLFMLVAGGSALAIGTLFMIAGAWPVLAFCSIEIVLLYGAFRLNYRAGRAFERVRLTENALEVKRISAAGDVDRWQFEPTWLRVSIDDPPRHASQLTISSHGRSLVIGAFLSPMERLEVALALRTAMQRWQNRWHPAIA